jgi:hypothetical protein
VAVAAVSREEEGAPAAARGRKKPGRKESGG